MPDRKSNAKSMHMVLPNALAAIPGVDAAAPVMMKNPIRKKGVASIAEPREAAAKLDINLFI